MRHPAGETVTVTRKGEPTGEYDGQGSPIIGPDTAFDIEDVPVAPAGSTEDPQNIGLWVVTGFTLYLPYGTVLLPTDRLKVRGVEGWQVVGSTEASGWRSPFTGKEFGAVVSVNRSA